MDADVLQGLQEVRTMASVRIRHAHHSEAVLAHRAVSEVVAASAVAGAHRREVAVSDLSARRKPKSQSS